MMFATLSRLTLLAVLIAAPWMFGGVSLNSRVWIDAGIALATALWLASLLTGGTRHARKSFRRGSGERWTPPFVVLCAGLILLFASFQLLPTRGGGIALTHAVLADWLPPDLPWRSLPAPISVTPGETLKELVQLHFSVCVLVLASVLFCDRPSRTILFAVAAANGAALAIFGVIQKLTWAGMLYWTFPLTFGHPFSAFVNRNNAAGYLNLCLACTVGLLWGGLACSPRQQASGRRRSVAGAATGRPMSTPPSVPIERFSRGTQRPAIAHDSGIVGNRYGWQARTILALSATISLGVTASASRGGIFSMVAMLLAAMWLFARYRWAKLILPGFAAVCVVVMVLISLGLDHEVRGRLESLRYVEQLDDPRLPHWDDTMQAIPDFLWFGSGLGSYAYAHRPYQRHVFHNSFINADSEYVEWLLEGGVTGFVLMGLLISAAWLVARRLLSPHFGPPVVDAGGVLVLVLVGQLLQSATDFGISLPANQFLAAALLGSAAGRARRRRRVGMESPTHPPLSASPHPPRDLALTLAGIALLIGSVFGWNQIREAQAAEALLGSFPAFDQPSEQSLLQTEIILARLSRKEIPMVNDGELHRGLARLHLYRLRMSILRKLRTRLGPSPPSDAALWEQTSPASLFAAMNNVNELDRSARLTELLPDQPSRKSLQLCLHHLQQARAIEPLLPGIDVLLACLASDAHNGSSGPTVRLSCEAVLSPVAAEKLSGLGAIAALAGDRTLACRCWNRSLAVDSSDPVALLEEAIRQVGESRVLDDVIPHASIDVLIEFARRTHGERDRALEIAIQQLSDDDAETCHQRGRIAALRGDDVSAIREYSAAIQKEPFALDRRLELAELLQMTGDRRGAVEQLEFCASVAPDRMDVRRLLQKMREAASSKEATE